MTMLKTADLHAYYGDSHVLQGVTLDVAKGAVTRAHHVCYCLTPMRYVWDMVDHYFGTGLKRSVAAPMISYLRRWDLATVDRVDDWIAISGEVRDRIRTLRRMLSTAPPLSISDLALDGSRLKELGFLPGPRFAEMLSYLLERVLERPELNNQFDLEVVLASGGFLPEAPAADPEAP